MLKISSMYAQRKLSFIVFIIVISGLAGIFFNSTKKGSGHERVLGATKKDPTPTLSPSITQVPTPQTTVTHVVKSRTVPLGFVVEDYTNRTGQISSKEEIFGSISTVSIFKQFGLSTNKDLSNQDLSYIKSKNIKLMIAWEPWNPQEGKSQSTDYLKEIGNGTQDEYIKSFARQIKEYSSPVIIRFGHEMNGDWYPWGKRPDDYRKAYQRVYEVFKNESVSNVTWMWSVNATPLEGLASYYPGSSYVDQIGIDGFNFGNAQEGHTWRTFEQIFGPTYSLLKSYGKPIMISETASTEFGGSKEEWVKQMFGALNSSLNGITEVVWFDLNKETDWRIDSSTSSLKAFQQGR